MRLSCLSIGMPRNRPGRVPCRQMQTLWRSTLWLPRSTSRENGTVAVGPHLISGLSRGRPTGATGCSHPPTTTLGQAMQALMTAPSGKLPHVRHIHAAARRFRTPCLQEQMHFRPHRRAEVQRSGRDRRSLAEVGRAHAACAIPAQARLDACLNAAMSSRPVSVTEDRRGPFFVSGKCHGRHIGTHCPGL